LHILLLLFVGCLLPVKMTWILFLKVKGYLLFLFFFADFSRRLKLLIGALVSGEPLHAMSGTYVLHVICVCVCVCACARVF